MGKILRLIIFVIAIGNFQSPELICQTFEFEYSTTDDDRLRDAIQTEDGCYYLVGYSAHPESYKHVGLILKLNHEGELVKERLVDIPGRTYEIYLIMQDTIGSIIIAGKTCDTTEEKVHVNLELRRLSYDLETLDSNKIILDSTRRVGGISKHLDRNKISLIFNLYSDIQPYTRNTILILTTSFDSLISGERDHFDGYQIHPMGDTAYWCVGVSSKVKYVKLDSFLQVTQELSEPNLMSQCFGLKWDTDTSFFMVGWTQQHDLGLVRQVHPFDSEGSWFNAWGIEDEWDFPAPSGALDYTNKDSIYVGATTPMSLYWPNFPSKYIVLQMDSTLSIRWERFYGDGNYYYELWKTFATSDGGCLLAGTRYDYESGIKERDIYLVKLDKNGLIVGQEEPPAIAVSEALVYPNPGTSEIHVRVAAQHPESVFQLFDMNGKTVLEQPITGKRAIIPAQFLDSGTYFYRISGPNGLLQSGKWIKM